VTRPQPPGASADRPRVPAFAWLLLLLALALATAPAWRFLLIEPTLPLEALLRLRC
jgi:hypothetical protein